MALEVLKTHKCFGGEVRYCLHKSRQTQTSMKFSCFLPSAQPSGALLWLSGLTCTEENFMTKAGAQKYLAENNLAVFCPDTSPRGLDLPEEHESIYFGSGASLYVDALSTDYCSHYNMYSYIQEEFVDLINKDFQILKLSILGHSMGGHGAMVIGLRNPQTFKSISSLAAVCHPSETAWCQRAFMKYLGSDPKLWQTYDTCSLLEKGHTHPQTLLVDQGLADESYLKGSLQTEKLEEACQKNGQRIEIAYHKNYDHSYYFVASFIEKHIAFHAKNLK